MLVSDKQMHRSAKEVGFMLDHLTDTITTFITSLYVTAGLAGIVLAMAIESCCIPLPSEIVMPLAGVTIVTGKLLAGVNFGLSLILVALAGSIGCLIGSVAAYGIGYAGGRPLMLKYGRYVLISQHDADRADHFFQKVGSATVFFARLLPVVRTYISLPAGNPKDSGANDSTLPNSPHRSPGVNHSNLPSSPNRSPGVNRTSHSGFSRHSNSRRGLRREITAAGGDRSANSKITGLARKIKEGEPEKAWILPSICDSPLLPHEPCNDRGKVLHLSCIDLKVGESVALALLKEMCNRLFSI